MRKKRNFFCSVILLWRWIHNLSRLLHLWWLHHLLLLVWHHLHAHRWSHHHALHWGLTHHLLRLLTHHHLGLLLHHDRLRRNRLLDVVCRVLMHHWLCSRFGLPHLRLLLLIFLLGQVFGCDQIAIHGAGQGQLDQVDEEVGAVRFGHFVLFFALFVGLGQEFALLLLQILLAKRDAVWLLSELEDLISWIFLLFVHTVVTISAYTDDQVQEEAKCDNTARHVNEVEH